MTKTEREEAISHVLFLAGYHVGDLMNPKRANLKFAASCHADMPLVEIAIEPITPGTWNDDRVWDLCRVSIEGTEIYRGNRCGARDAYMAEVAKVVNRIAAA